MLAGALAIAGCGPKGAARATPEPAADATPDAAVAEPPSPDAAVIDQRADRDGDGVPDATDLCPDQAMAMSSGCTPEMQRGCPDDCRPPRF